MMESLTDCPTEECATQAPTRAEQHPASHNDIDTACAMLVLRDPADEVWVIGDVLWCAPA